MCVMETGLVSALAESFGDDGGILLTGSFFPASLPKIKNIFQKAMAVELF